MCIFLCQVGSTDTALLSTQFCLSLASALHSCDGEMHANDLTGRAFILPHLHLLWDVQIGPYHFRQLYPTTPFDPLLIDRGVQLLTATMIDIPLIHQ